MSENTPIAVYLNNHLAEVSSAIDLAERMAEHHHGTDLGDVLATIAAAVKEEHTTLREIMERLDIGTSHAEASRCVAEREAERRQTGR